LTLNTSDVLEGDIHFLLKTLMKYQNYLRVVLVFAVQGFV